MSGSEGLIDIAALSTHGAVSWVKDNAGASLQPATTGSSPKHDGDWMELTTGLADNNLPRANLIAEVAERLESTKQFVGNLVWRLPLERIAGREIDAVPESGAFRE